MNPSRENTFRTTKTLRIALVISQCCILMQMRESIVHSWFEGAERSSKSYTHNFSVQLRRRATSAAWRRRPWCRRIWPTIRRSSATTCRRRKRSQRRKLCRKVSVHKWREFASILFNLNRFKQTDYYANLLSVEYFMWTFSPRNVLDHSVGLLELLCWWSTLVLIIASPENRPFF